MPRIFFFTLKKLHSKNVHRKRSKILGNCQYDLNILLGICVPICYAQYVISWAPLHPRVNVEYFKIPIRNVWNFLVKTFKITLLKL